MDFFDVVAAEHRGTQIPGNTTIWMIAFGATDSNDAFAVSFMAPCSTAFACFSSAAQVQEKKCLSRRDGKQFVEHFVFVLGWTSRHHYGATVGNRCEGKEHVVCMFDSIECCLGGIDVSPFTSIRRNIHNGVLAVIAGCLIFFLLAAAEGKFNFVSYQWELWHNIWAMFWLLRISNVFVGELISLGDFLYTAEIRYCLTCNSNSMEFPAYIQGAYLHAAEL